METTLITPDITLFSQWLTFKLNKEQSTDNVYFEYSCRDIKVEYFEHVVRQLVLRHEILRYSFCVTDNALKIKVDLPENIPVKIIYADYADSAASDEQLTDAIDTAIKAPFNLEVAPLFRCYLVRVGQSDYKFIFVIPHVLVDTHTLHMFYDETSAMIEKIAQGEAHPELPPMEMQFAACIKEQNCLDRSSQSEPTAYWLTQFKEGAGDVYLGDKVSRQEIVRSKMAYEQLAKEFLMRNDITVDFSLVLLLNSYKSFRYLTYIQVLRKPVLERLQAFARMSNTTIFSIMASCYYLAIYRITQQSNITLSYTVSTRNSIKKQHTSGPFLNLLFINRHVNENVPVIAFIRETHHQINQMKAHCTASMPAIWQKAGLSPYSNIPIDINYFINQHNVITESIVSHTGNHHRYDGEFGFDIALKAIQGTDGLVLCYNYREEFFSRQRIEMFSETLSDLVNKVTDSPDVPISYHVRSVYDMVI